MELRGEHTNQPIERENNLIDEPAAFPRETMASKENPQKVAAVVGEMTDEERESIIRDFQIQGESLLGVSRVTNR